MANLSGKGYGHRASVFTFDVNGKILVVSSNACREEDVRSKMKLPEGTRLKDATTFNCTDGKTKPFYVDFIWAVEGSVPSGKGVTEHLLNLGIITYEQAQDILNAKTVRL